VHRLLGEYSESESPKVRAYIESFIGVIARTMWNVDVFLMRGYLGELSEDKAVKCVFRCA